MPLGAVEVIKDIIKRLRPKKCLEWGMGYGTLIFCSLLEKDSIWYAIEHDAEWFNRISGYSKRLKNIKAFLVAPNNFPWTDENDDGSYSDLEDYINFPEQYGKFNFILVDGRARLDCLSKAHEMLEDRGVVILHDAERKFYHAAFKLYKYSILISEEPKSIWIGSNAPDINKIIDADRYKKLWRLFNRRR
ncbi:MAG: hypothetical protein JW788_07625 [Candidatus Omnitrophica bacterium]|nr:hypothetical protein [Candidatus Omnitrophota bacterium]